MSCLHAQHLMLFNVPSFTKAMPFSAHIFFSRYVLFAPTLLDNGVIKCLTVWNHAISGPAAVLKGVGDTHNMYMGIPDGYHLTQFGEDHVVNSKVDCAPSVHTKTKFVFHSSPKPQTWKSYRSCFTMYWAVRLTPCA